MGAILFAGALTARAAAPATQESWRNDPKHEARRLVAQAADRSLQKTGVDGILELVNKKDRTRLEKDIDRKEEQKFQELADKAQAMWKEKYTKNFDAQMNVEDLKDLEVTFSGSGKEQKAVVKLPPEPGEPSYEVHLMKESNGFWRFELPDTLTGQNFYNNLIASVQKLIDQKDRLPGSKDKAYERGVAWLVHEMAFPATGEAVPAAEKK
jgi:hypothetical protein